MTQVVYAISDIHGHLDAFRLALETVDLQGDPDASLILLGDYVDRVPDSRGVLELVRSLQQRHGDRVIALLGNHDAWMLDWLDADDDDLSWLQSDPNFITVACFVPQEIIDAIPVSATGTEINATIRREVRDRHADLIAWLRRLPLVHETQTQIFVHAGVDESAEDLWRAATPEHWFTEKFPATTGTFFKTIIAGHVRTSGLNADGSHGVFHDGESHYCIDDAVEVTGLLNVLRYDSSNGTYSWWR